MLSTTLKTKEENGKDTKRHLMRVDLLIIAIGLLLAVAMALTLLFGREYSLHGYGSVVPHPKESTPLVPYSVNSL
jgi:hypothetical protein